MKNKILCLLALLLSAITWADDTFADKTSSVETQETSSVDNSLLPNDTKPVEIKKMSSFKNLPSLNNQCQQLSFERYGTLIKNLNELIKKDGGKYPTIKDFTTGGKILAQATLYEFGTFLGVRKYPSSNGGNVFSLDHSWPNIRRIAEKLADKGADAILKETFHRTKYAVKCIYDKRKEKEYQEIVLGEIKKNLKALGDLLEKIKGVKIKPEERSEVTLLENQLNDFIDLCVGKDAVFDITLLNNSNKGLFCDRLGEMLKNYSGFQRICSILAMRLINTIMSRGVRGASIKIEDKNEFAPWKNEIRITQEVLTGKYRNNCYSQDGIGKSAVVHHEMTHFFHSMIALIGFNDFDLYLKFMAVYNICNSKHSLLDLFFPVLSANKKMDSIVREIKKKLENLDQNADSTKKAIYPIYQKVVQAGFGNLLFKNEEIDKLTSDNLCESERLAKAIYIASSCLKSDETLVWTNVTEILTMNGILPLFVDGDKTYMLEDRQNEEVYNIRGEKERSEFQSNEEIKKFRYHSQSEYKNLSAKINTCLNELCASSLEPNEDLKINEMQFPEHLPFSSTLDLNKQTNGEAANDILGQCKGAVEKYIDGREEKELIGLLEYFIRRGHINSVELFRKKVFPKFDWKNFDLLPIVGMGNLSMLCLILSERGYGLTSNENEKILKDGTRGAIKEIIADVNPDMNIDGSRPLNCLLKRGFLDMAKVLIDKIDKNERELNFDDWSSGRNDTGNKPLHFAIEKGYIDIVMALLDKGANADAPANKDDCTPLHCAAMGGYLEVVNALLDKKAKVNAVDMNNCTPLHYAAMKGHVTVVNALLAREGVDVNAVDHDTRTPLHYAAENGHVVVVNALLGKEAKTDIVDIRGRTPLHLAVANSHVAAVNALLEKEADANAVNAKSRNRTALHFAANNSNVALVEALLKAGADAGIISGDKETPLDEAAYAFLSSVKNREFTVESANIFIAIHNAITNNNKANKPIINQEIRLKKALSKAKELVEK
ncbi:MAG: ankyrin repeat domain-containing protein [Holosporaceae bacterium]|nr:ankyrin repeat domain-containing protein [Holosporaceae bacterium]